MNVYNNLTAIILAAGQGKRIGQAKLGLLAGGETFLNKIVGKLIAVGIKDIVCVVRANNFPADPRITFTINPKPEHDMFSSIYCGIRERPTASGYMIFPVDHPFVAQDTLQKLQENFTTNSDQVICPEFKQRLGHPIIIPEHLAKKIIFSDYIGGLRQFLLDQEVVICKVNVADENILRNINYESDLI
jgi:CTP:molybdopterin cytidylyltransferase MocA